MTVSAVKPPKTGVWRVGRGPDPLELRDALTTDDLQRSGVGNRFDSPVGDFRVLYFGRTLEACFGETLARFRPSIELLAAVKDEWRDRGFLEPGAIPREWRERRIAVRVRFDTSWGFVDVEDADTIEVFRSELAKPLLALGHRDLDISLIRGPDRRITRLISQWVHDQSDADGEPLYAGIRYLSRLDSRWECGAAYGDVRIVELVRQPIFLDDPSLRRVARTFDLIVH